MNCCREPLLDDPQPSLPSITVLAFALPSLGVGCLYLLYDVYVLKFSTDSLFIPPATMGVIFSLSRLWDAISDPLAGYLSDITRSNFGRRRMWMLCSAPPLGMAFACTFSPPLTLAGGGVKGSTALAGWMLGSILTYYTALTAFKMPSSALGVELSEHAAYHERSRLYGYRSLLDGCGALLGVGLMALLMGQESAGPAAVRGVATRVGSAAGAFTTITIFVSVALLREASGRHIVARGNPFSAWASVLRSPHARLFTYVLVLHDGCKASFANLAPFALEYVLLVPSAMVPVAIAAYLFSTVLAVPLWLALGRRFGKVNALWASLVLNSVAYVPLLFVLSEEFVNYLSVPQRLVFACVCAALIGVAASARNNLGESVMGDIIDSDHAETRERKQGVFFSFWMFAQKSAGGCVTLSTGFLLDASGFVPNEAQSYATKLAIAAMFGLVPAIAMVTAACLFSRFRLDEVAHAEVRATIAKNENEARASLVAEAPTAAAAALHTLTRGRCKSQQLQQQQQVIGQPSLL